MIVVVGGHTRNIGKTTVMCRIIQETRNLHWTAIKVTQYGHGECAEDGMDCRCAPKSSTHPYALDEEQQPSDTDSGRYLAAGAAKSFWLRTRQGELAEGMPIVRELLTRAENTIIESNSILDFLIPDFYVFVRDSSIEDFKLSAQRHYRRADLVVEMNTPGIGELVRQRATGKRIQSANR